MMTIKNRLEKAYRDCSKYNTKILAVSKKQSIDKIIEAYNLGHRDFGENQVQELLMKMEKLAHLKDIRWHFIGHLQRNKVKKIIPYVNLIHAIDSQKLLLEINNQSKKYNMKTPVLLQIHIAQEINKFGLTYKEVEKLLNDPVLSQLQNITIKGMMGMATNTKEKKVVDSEFCSLSDFYCSIKNNNKFKTSNIDISILSMGMSNDYNLALRYNPTIVRLGSNIFGERDSKFFL